MYLERVERLRSAVCSGGLGAVALNAGPSLTYLTGASFHLSERPILAFIDAEANQCIVLPEMERAKVEAACPWLGVYAYAEDEASLTKAVGDAVHRMKLSACRIGVEPSRIRMLELALLSQAAPSARVVPAGRLFSELRAVKDESEIQALRRSVAVAEAALAETVPYMKKGVSELDLATELTYRLLKAGSHVESLATPIVASGPNSALPHAVPGNRCLQARDLVVIDWGASSCGYLSDLTRTFSVEETSAQQRIMHGLVLRANEAGRAAVRPAVVCSAIDSAARGVIASGGYGQYFTHRTGHGIGLEIHETPNIRSDNLGNLVPGMVFTVEPGIYQPGFGGVRVEDDVLVTTRGCETLSSISRALRVVG